MFLITLGKWGKPGIAVARVLERLPTGQTPSEDTAPSNSLVFSSSMNAWFGLYWAVLSSLSKRSFVSRIDVGTFPTHILIIPFDPWLTVTFLSRAKISRTAAIPVLLFNAGCTLVRGKGTGS